MTYVKISSLTRGVADALPTLVTFQQQADAVLSQANPVSATLYTVLATTSNVQIRSLSSTITWAVTQPTPLEIIVTIDGNSWIFTRANPDSATAYVPFRDPYRDSLNEASQLLISAWDANTLPVLAFEGRSIKVEARITWAITQPTSLVNKVKYGKR